MGLVGRRKAVIACIAIVAVLASVGIAANLSSRAGFEIDRAAQDSVPVSDIVEYQEAGEDVPQEDEDAVTGPIVVHVDGAVANPGVYEFLGGDPRVSDAVELAGGLLEDADTTSVNLAARVADGQKVLIPHEGEELVTPTAGSASGGAGSCGLVNINVASAEELEALPGVGEATAAAIIEERERGGPFLSPEDVMRVPGIGQKKFERMSEFIVV